MSSISRPLPIKDKGKVNYWVEQYLQAKLEGKKELMKMYADIILKLGGKIPK